MIRNQIETLQKALGHTYSLKYSVLEGGKIALYINYCEVSKLFCYEEAEMTRFLDGAITALLFKSGDILIEGK